MKNKYTKMITMRFDGQQHKFTELRIGQWVKNANPSKDGPSHGQFMGLNEKGNPVVRWQKRGTKFGEGNPRDHRADARANNAVRQLVKLYDY